MIVVVAQTLFYLKTFSSANFYFCQATTGWIRTLDLTLYSLVLYHCAAAASHLLKFLSQQYLKRKQETMIVYNLLMFK
jgi:hypothetical protein